VEPSREIEEHHRAVGVVEFFNELLELRDGQNPWLLRALASSANAHQLHGIRADTYELPTHGAIHEQPHKVLQMSLGFRSQVELFQPLLHAKGFDFPDGLVAPSRLDVVCEIRAVGVSGRSPDSGGAASWLSLRFVGWYGFRNGLYGIFERDNGIKTRKNA
jgi:hypothetical protein